MQLHAENVENIKKCQRHCSSTTEGWLQTK